MVLAKVCTFQMTFPPLKILVQTSVQGGSMCMWEPEDSLEYCFHGTVHLPQGSACLYLSSTEIITQAALCPPTPPHFFSTLLLGLELRSLYLQAKPFVG